MAAAKTLDPLVLEAKKYILIELVKEREHLQKELQVEIDRIKSELTVGVWKLPLIEFLRLCNLPTTLNAIDSNNKTHVKTLEENYEIKKETDKFRRVTRSVIRNSNISVVATPKFHPGLPETPAVIREKRSRKEKEKDIRTSNIFDDPNQNGKNTDQTFRRITRATLRSSILANISNDQKSPDNRISRKRAAASIISPEGIVSLELDDGKKVDVDLTKSPSDSTLANLGPTAIKDLGNLFKAYASKMNALYKKCKVALNK